VGRDRQLGRVWHPQSAVDRFGAWTYLSVETSFAPNG
jgi:hypothetical protein